MLGWDMLHNWRRAANPPELKVDKFITWPLAFLALIVASPFFILRIAYIHLVDYRN